MNGYEVEIFYDGECPLCTREVRLLRRLDKKQRVHFTDIASADFDPAPLGLSQAALMAEIHGRLPDGQLVRGVEVFRRVYAAVGLRALARISRWPGLAPALEAGYRVFARNRLKLTGRCSEATCAVERTEPLR